MGGIRLVVQADDLGLCRAVNEGIEHGVVDGIVTQTSVMAPTPARTAHLLRWLERLDDGVHLVLSHPGVESSELRAMCDPEDKDAAWAQAWRSADLVALTDREVRALIERRGIDLVSVTEL